MNREDYEEIGTDEYESLLGYEEIGGVSSQKRLPGGTRLVSRNPDRERELIIGVDSGAGTIAATTQAAITVRPQTIFRAERLLIPSGIAGSYTVDDLRIGKNSQFVNTGAVPASVFAENAVGVRLKMDTARTAMDIVLTVTNQSAAILRFRAALVGTSLE